MIEKLLSLTSLPNLHPAVVHFPIALLPTALVFDLVGFSWSRHRDWMSRGAQTLYAAGALAAGAAYWAGRRAADSLIDVPPSVQSHLNHHSDWGLNALWLVAGVAISRLALGWWDPESERPVSRTLSAIGGVAAVAVVFYTAELGGGLVYRHGVAVDRQEETAESPPPAAADTASGRASPDAGPPSQRLLRSEDGTLTWAPLPEDGAALGSLLRPARGSSLAAVSRVEPDSRGQRGLAVRVDGRTLLVLSGERGDVQVEAELELAGFDGTVGLAHHVRSARQAGLFTLETASATYALRTLRGDQTETLDESSGELPSGPLRLAVSAAGRHLRGMVDGATVVHGHQPALPEGRCGILLDGRGEVRVVSLRIAPISD